MNMKKLSSTIFKKGDPRLMGNQYAKGNKPNRTAIKVGEHCSPKTEFKQGVKKFGESNPYWKGGKPMPRMP